MKLLLARGQTDSSGFSLVPLKIGSGVIFKLKASLELNDEERKLLQKYQLERAALVTSDTVEDLKKGFRPAVVLGLICFVVMWFLTSTNVAFIASVLLTMAMTIVYFRSMREQIVVNDLLGNGRMFHCDSVVTLIEKEDDLARMSQFLRQVIESAKYWDDREAIAIEPLDRTELKKAILRAAR